MGWQPELAGEPLEVRFERELRPQSPLARVAERAAARRIDDEGLQRARECHGVRLAHQEARVISDELRDGRDASRDAGEALALGLRKHVRQTIAIAVARDAARQRE